MKEINMDAITTLMNDDTREQVHRELAPCTPLEFLKRYCEIDENFEDVLKSEFSICLLQEERHEKEYCNSFNDGNSYNCRFYYRKQNCRTKNC